MMMINRRRVYGGKKLPYDAEVEYLKCTGTQAIYTGIYSGNATKAVLDAKLDTIIVQCRLIGCQNGSFEFYVNGSSRWSGISNGAAASGGSSNPANTNRHTFIISNIENEVYVDNRSWSMQHNAASYQGYIISLFARINSVYSEQEGNISFCQGLIYSSQIYEGNTIVRDYIPVRVGQVGYLFDKVSGQLFGNAGTGNFILGPDV